MVARVLIIALVGGFAGSAPMQAQQKLPLKRVVLLTSGVGYYEHTGTVRGDATIELRFRSDQINDVLKSLLVQDLGGGTVSVVSLPTADPIEKTLKSFEVDLTGHPSLPKLLEQLRGEPVEVSGARTLSGTIVGVEQRRRRVDDQIIDQPYLSVLTDAGLQIVPIDDAHAFRLADPALDAELHKALETIAAGRDQQRKTVRIVFHGAGERRVRVGYLLEAPLWKASYRLALEREGKAWVQGWGIVENTTETDWQDVQLSLVSGRPISFVMDLYTPLYVPRPKEELELFAGLRPPSYAEGVEKAENLFTAEAREGRKAAGRLRALGRPAAAAEAAVAPSAPAMSLRPSETGVVARATGGKLGALFEYRIDTPVSIPRQHAAMLPILAGEVSVERVSIYGPQSLPDRPLRGVWLTNDTGLHLMQGPVTVLEEGSYAGDAKLPDLAPGQQRLLSYAVDLAVRVLRQEQSQPQRLVSLRIVRGTLFERYRQLRQTRYTIKNSDERPRTLIIEHPHAADWKVIEPKEVWQRAEGLSRLRIDVPAKQTVTLAVRLERAIETRVALSNVASDRIAVYLRSDVISEQLRQALERVQQLQSELAKVRKAREDVETQLDELMREQARVRKNIQALPRESDAWRRQVSKLDALETQIEQARQRLDDLRRQEAQRQEALDAYLSRLDVP